MKPIRQFLGPVLLIVVLAIVFLFHACALTDADSEETSHTEQEFTFSSGITIGGVNVEGMTEDEAKRALIEAEAEIEDTYHVTASYGEETLVITASDLSLSFHTEDALEQAKTYSNTLPKEIGTDGQPKTKDFPLTPSFDQTGIEKKVSEFAEAVNRDPVEPDVADFDFDTLEFICTEGEDGLSVDTEALTQEILHILEMDHAGEAEVSVTSVPPSTTLEDLQSHLGQVATFSTTSTNGENANHNMKKAMELLDRQVIPSGGVLSFHGAVGDSMDESLGWLPAGAWKDGELIQESGGGICQAATTIYGCGLRANMAVVERYCHLRPSVYVPEGLDATVDYPYVDLKMQNVSGYPIYLAASMEGLELTAAMYGYITDEFDEIRVDSKRTGTVPMPDPIYEEDPSLAKGEIVLDRTGYEGIQAAAWRIYYKDGEEIRREDLPESYYSEVAPIYKIGPGTNVEE